MCECPEAIALDLIEERSGAAERVEGVKSDSRCLGWAQTF